MELLSMAKAILIAVNDGFGGYGDFLFALKLSQQLKKKCIEAGEEVPPFYIVTQDTGQERIRRLGGDVEFGVEVLTPDELKKRIETVDMTKKIDVGSLIEGPVFNPSNSSLIDRVELALSSVPSPIPMTLIREYGYSSESSIFRYCAAYRSTLKHIDYRSRVHSGVNPREAGILLSDELLTPPAPSILATQLDEKMRLALFGSGDITHYQSTTALSMQYSHDTHDVDSDPHPASHFLNIHREFAKESSKNQDVIMVGKSIEDKQRALLNIKDKLIADGFTRISFYNADTKEEEVIHDTHEAATPAKTYRVVYTQGMSHASMIAATALSGPLFGATGDQSFGEAISGDKIMAYECLSHKRDLINDYDAAITKASGDDPLIIETLYLLRTANTDSNYSRLGLLIRNPDIQKKLATSNKTVRQQNDLSEKIFFDSLGIKKITGVIRRADKTAARDGTPEVDVGALSNITNTSAVKSSEPPTVVMTVAGHDEVALPATDLIAKVKAIKDALESMEHPEGPSSTDVGAEESLSKYKPAP